jgi:hypothetical protein
MNIAGAVVIVSLAIGLVILSGTTTNTTMDYSNTAYAQSGSATQQQLA